MTYHSRSGSTVRIYRRRRRRPVRRLLLIVGAGAAAAGVVAASHSVVGKTRPYRLPSRAGLAALSEPQQIAAIARSQVGYTTDPSYTYCNKFSAFWSAGDACSGGGNAEEWCADFAAWVWRKAGVQFTYGYDPGDINGAAASFYEWAVANGRWHPATPTYVAAPGDIAVYGLSLGTKPRAAHVAIVVRDLPGRRGPDVINGDGSITAFSTVETVGDQRFIAVGRKRYPLSGFASPPT